MHHQIILPHDNSPQPSNSKELIANCDLIIAEVSYPSTGQGIELGWADDLNISIYAIYREGFKYSSSLNLIAKAIDCYRNENQLLDVVSRIIVCSLDGSK